MPYYIPEHGEGRTSNNRTKHGLWARGIPLRPRNLAYRNIFGGGRAFSRVRRQIQAN